jgi:hypothetical protein
LGVFAGLAGFFVGDAAEDALFVVVLDDFLLIVLDDFSLGADFERVCFLTIFVLSAVVR